MAYRNEIADTYNNIWVFLRMKGTARVVFFILDFIALAICINNKTRRMVIFALSIAFVLLLTSCSVVFRRLQRPVEIWLKPGCLQSSRCLVLLIFTPGENIGFVF